VTVAIDESRLEHRWLSVGDVNLHCVFAGDEGAPLVVLLHGFPELWYAWRRQILVLADAGFRVVAPDMRGYNLSDKPRDVSAYGSDLLAGDIDGLVRACGREKSHVVGHDWGGGVAWMFAMKYPARLDRLVILNCPHPAVMMRALRRPEQLKKSWYMFFFQLPWLPERGMRANHFGLLLRVLREEPLVPGAFDERDLAVYAEAYAQPGALRGMTNYYRAMLREPRDAKSFAPILAPVLVLWGERDPHLGSEMATPDRALVPDARVELIADATHWVHHERPELVSARILDFLRTPRSR
jgi:pimeloyl-ACP methyl ester carboxylesterase